MSIQNLFIPKPLDSYFDLTNGGDFEINLSQKEAALILKISDYGLSSLNQEELQDIEKVIFTLKCEIWP